MFHAWNDYQKFRRRKFRRQKFRRQKIRRQKFRRQKIRREKIRRQKFRRRKFRPISNSETNFLLISKFYWKLKSKLEITNNLYYLALFHLCFPSALLRTLNQKLEGLGVII